MKWHNANCVAIVPLCFPPPSPLLFFNGTISCRAMGGGGGLKGADHELSLYSDVSALPLPLIMLPQCINVCTCPCVPPLYMQYHHLKSFNLFQAYVNSVRMPVELWNLVNIFLKAYASSYK